MYYVITGRDTDASLQRRLAARAAHLARLQDLLEQGRLLVAGPCPAVDGNDPGPAGFTGSVIIAEFASLDEATEWAQADPYVAAGVFRSVAVRPFRRVLP
jgi:hypothetical protein